MRKYIAEFIGTFTLVLFGCAVAVLLNDIVAISLAFGLAIVASAYAFGKVSGCHVNPAVSLAMLIDGRMSVKDFIGYVVAQIAGAFAATGTLYYLLSESVVGTTNLGANGYGSGSILTVSMLAAFILEIILTFIFVYAVLGVTKDESKANISPIVIGLTLVFVHLLGIPFTGTSVNPARSLAPAVIQGGEALKQVWLFIVAPLVGGCLSAIAFKYLNKQK